MSIVFDRAVEFYDRTRALPPQHAAKIIDTLIRETGIGPRSRVLEMGVGTGRIAVPVARRGIPVTGVDLSLKMMEVLAQKVAGTEMSVRLAQADVLALPFADNAFDLDYAVHVLHLVQGWQDAMAEARRVVKPGGYLVVNWHRRQSDSVNRVLRNKMRELALEYGVDATRPGAKSEEEILEELRRQNGDVRIVPVAEWTDSSSVREEIDTINQQLHSETWLIPRPIMDKIVPKLTEFAIDKFGSLDTEIASAYSFNWLIAHKV